MERLRAREEPSRSTRRLPLSGPRFRTLVSSGITTFAEYRVRGPSPYVSRVAFSTDHAKRPIRSEVMFFSCASAWRDPSKWSGNMRSRRSLPNARSSSSASHFEPYHERVASMMRPIIRGSASASGLNAPVAMASSTSWTL